MSWSPRKKKRASFVSFFLSKGNFFKICVLSQCILYWIHFQNIHTFTYQKTLLHTLLLLVFKIVESLRCILKDILQKNYVFFTWYRKIFQSCNSQFPHFWTINFYVAIGTSQKMAGIMALQPGALNLFHSVRKF